MINSLSKYLKECVINDLSPADFESIKDGQIKWLIEKIMSLSKNKACTTVLDYGCGNMRLYNALSKLDLKFMYVGADFKRSDNINELIHNNDNCNFICLSEITRIERHCFDIVCVSNVIHEISIIEFVEVIYNTKLLLSKDGHFLLLDMSVLPQGELLGLPYFPDEILDLFEPIDYTFTTEKGYPIIACDIMPSDLMLPHTAIEKLCYLIMKKRDEFSFLAFSIINKYGMDIFNKKFNNINKRMSNEDLLGYILYLSGLSNFRISEFRQEHTYSSCNEFYVDLINLFTETFERTGKQLLLHDMYSSLYPKYPLREIVIKLKQATSPHSLFRFEDEKTLYATERLDYFIDNFTFDDLRESGIFVISAMCEVD